MLELDVRFTSVGILCVVAPPPDWDRDNLCNRTDITTKVSHPSSSPGARWRTPPGIVLYWKLLEDMYVVYNSGSGHTHVLNPIAALVVQELSERELETSELLQRIGAVLNFETTEEFNNELHQTLSDLDKLGLVEPLIF
jgi:PqqD family protein of HPr-rel-A system